MKHRQKVGFFHFNSCNTVLRVSVGVVMDIIIDCETIGLGSTCTKNDIPIIEIMLKSNFAMVFRIIQYYRTKPSFCSRALRLR